MPMIKLHGVFYKLVFDNLESFSKSSITLHVECENGWHLSLWSLQCQVLDFISIGRDNKVCVCLLWVLLSPYTEHACIVMFYVPGKPVVSYRWIDLSLRNNWLKLETSGELPTTLEESIEEFTSNMKAIPEDVNM